MTETFFKELQLELKKGCKEKNHPFRYCTMATVGLDRMARLRTVVLRNMTDEFVFSIYTDRRSKKIVHIKENNKVSLLFYHPKKLLQLKIEGLAMINKDPDIVGPLWKEVSEDSRKDYSTANAPGSALENPDHLEYLNNQDYFCLVEIHPFKIEYLKLKKPNHLRVRFSRRESQWKGEFLVP